MDKPVVVIDELKIRKAQIEDLSNIQELNHELFLHDNEFHHDLNTNWSRGADGEEYFRRSIESDRLRLSIVAEVEGRVVGYLVARMNDPSTIYLGKRAELENMCVTADFRGLGIGTKLIDEFKAWAHGQGAERLMVEAFYDNVDARRFYERNGFKGYAVMMSRVDGDEAA